jgi:hypothetical protein
MKIKTLAIAAATLAVGAITSQAQVYSQNIVGYINQVCPLNTLVLAANPLDNGTNDLNSLLGALPSKSTVQVWNGAGYTTITKGATWPAQTIPVGTGFFIKSAALITNTYTGTVVCPVGGTVTNALALNTLYLVGSKIPYATDLNDTNLGLNILPSKSTIQLWNGAGYTTLTKGATWPAGNTNPVAGGFFVKSAAATNWVQSLPAQ